MCVLLCVLHVQGLKAAPTRHDTDEQVGREGTTLSNTSVLPMPGTFVALYLDGELRISI